MAHELAHIRHGDWESWAFSSAAVAVIRWVALPSALLLAVGGAAGLGDTIPLYFQVQDRIDDARDYHELYAHLKSERAETPYPGALGSSPYGQASPWQQMLETPDEKLDQMRAELVGTASDLVMTHLLPLLVALGWLRWILRIRKVTEIAADRIAALTTSPADVCRALTMFAVPSWRWGWLSAHPSVRSRVEALAALAGPGHSPFLEHIRPPTPAGKKTPRGLSAQGGLHQWLNPTERRLRGQRALLFALPLALGYLGQYIVELMLSSAAIDPSSFIGDAMMLALLDMHMPLVIAGSALMALLSLVTLRHLESTLKASIAAAVVSALVLWLTGILIQVYVFETALPEVIEAIYPALVLHRMTRVALPMFVFFLALDRALIRQRPLPAYAIASAWGAVAYWLEGVLSLALKLEGNDTVSVIYLIGLAEPAIRLLVFAACATLLWLSNRRPRRLE